MAPSMIRAAVLGKPIAHSLSPFVHGEIYRALGLKYEYGRIELDQQQARDFLQQELKNSWSGFSLTMPLKEVGFHLGLKVEDVAKRSRAINTVTRSGAFNTDATGLARVLAEHGDHYSNVLIIGNGASARSSLLGLEIFGYRGEVSILRRNPDRDFLLPKIAHSPLQSISMDQEWRESLIKSSLVISTIPAQAQTDISAKLLGFEGTFLDFSYSPWPSTFASVVSGRVISGLSILVAQAVDQAAIFSGEEFDRGSMFREVLSSTMAHQASQ